MEAREQFAKYWRRTAMAIPAKLINKAIGNLAHRAAMVLKAKGGLIEEGGRA